jgi:hypothetical protein
MNNLREQTVCINFYFKLGITASEIYMLQTSFGEDALSKSQINRWLSRLTKEG